MKNLIKLISSILNRYNCTIYSSYINMLPIDTKFPNAATLVRKVWMLPEPNFYLQLYQTLQLLVFCRSQSILLVLSDCL